MSTIYVVHPPTLRTLFNILSVANLIVVFVICVGPKLISFVPFFLIMFDFWFYLYSENHLYSLFRIIYCSDTSYYDFENMWRHFCWYDSNCEKKNLLRFFCFSYAICQIWRIKDGADFYWFIFFFHLYFRCLCEDSFLDSAEFIVTHSHPSTVFASSRYCRMSVVVVYIPHLKN